jgi:secreted PhoX family phosphatase
LRRAWPSLSGTLQNCAGGVTPWGTWLSCEEYVAEGVRGGDVQAKFLPGIQREHGFVFEVPPAGVRNPAPLVALGQFRHEAAVVHVGTGDVYMTEDRLPFAGFYRTVPTEPGRLSRGGRLQMLSVREHRELRRGLAVGQSWPVTWVDIEDPMMAHTPGTHDGLGVLNQGRAAGGSVFKRLEGCVAGADTVWFTSTSGGDAGYGQIFAYHVGAQRLELIFESSGPEAIDYPDNICLGPHGGLVICEDGGRDAQLIWGMTPDGGRFPLAQNAVVLNDGPQGISGDFRRAEWAGCCFSPDGKWLFANVYKPGFTVAITGPWKTGLI